ncbi:MAG: MFS transporter [Syntrophothermus sp.]|uniref:MFS transporter n=1 Tax=Syntrophothermus sp. TaxID=2736299 RepID=UPI00257BD772|nr:MFS transporter [Syntrophothermus sp.]NSW83593.1 MFS transporter [Syntrophothermus sp.]
MSLPSRNKLTYLLCAAMTVEVANTFLFAYFLTVIAGELGLSRGITALLGYAPLAVGVLGGYLVGLIADLFGRKTGLLLSLSFSGLGAVLTGLSSQPWSLVLARLIIGLTLAGTWASAVVLGNESVPQNYRGRISSAVQVGFPLGNLLCSALLSLLGPRFGWHGSFIGLGLIIWFCVLLLTLKLDESPLWHSKSTGADRARLGEIFNPPYRRIVFLASCLSLLGMFSGFALQTSVPRFFETMGFSGSKIPLYTALAWVAATLGYAYFGLIADRYGDAVTLIGYMLGAIAFSMCLGLVPQLLMAKGDWARAKILAILFTVLMMYTTGFFSGYGSVYSALFPTDIRTNAVGFAFNFGRFGNALAPFAVEMLAERLGIGYGLILAALPLGVAAIMVWRLQRAKFITWERINYKEGSWGLRTRYSQKTYPEE